MLNDKRITACLCGFDSGAYSRLEFLRAVSHSVGAHTEALQPRDDSSSSSSSEDEDEASQAPAATTSAASESATAAAASTSDDCCQVCLVAPRAGFALVPCGHARCCEACAVRVSDMAARDVLFVVRTSPRQCTSDDCAEVRWRCLA